MRSFTRQPLIVKNNIARFLEEDSDYTGNFGFQWNKFSKTQIDESNQSSVSKERLFAETNWPENSFENLDILEAGSGAGRFTEVLLKHTKANIFSFDYSNAVEANYKSNSHYGDRLNLFQCSIYEIPFEPQSFDKVLCLGVLQHTPDFRKSVHCLCDMVKSGGELVVDFYPINGFWTKIHAKYILRPWLKKMSNEELLKLIDNNIDWMIGLSKFLNSIGLSFLTRFIPICDIKTTMPEHLSAKELREWCVLDTFDMFSPEYDQPQRITTVANWIKEAGLNVTFADFVEVKNMRGATVRAVRV